jgi:hypothetical protein
MDVRDPIQLGDEFIADADVDGHESIKRQSAGDGAQTCDRC